MKKITFLLLSAVCFLAGCTFGNESSTGAVFGDYVFSILIAIGVSVSAISAVSYYIEFHGTGKKNINKEIFAFVGFTVALAFYLFAKFS